MSDFEIRPLGNDTWDAFVALCDRHGGGGFGGCYCTWFQRDCKAAPELPPGAPSKERTLFFKHSLVESDNSHAALVFDGEEAIAWAQYGSPEELPGIMHKKDVAAAEETPPDWRITCVFTDRRYRRRGVTLLAVQGALDLIARAGGGLVESYPQDVPEGKKISASFLYNSTLSTFQKAGFTYIGPKGKNHCIVRTTVPAH